MCDATRTAGVGAQCYDRAVKKWLVVGAVIVAIGIALAVMLLQRDPQSPQRAPLAGTGDAVVEDFRAVERQAIAAFNAALRQQRENQIDEVELALAIERDVLEPWRAMRARVAAAPVPAERTKMYEAMRRYIDLRLVAWHEYAEGLRAQSEAEARPHFDKYHASEASADAEARVLGGLFRAATN
jgi:hypothetical protein